jgi:predicted metal-dependent HD superfamily phosphohydrolase
MTDQLTTSAFLHVEFTKVIQSLKGDEIATRAWPDSLIQAYTELQRHYHTITHISSMLRLSQSHQYLITNPTVIQLAIFFHDWVYDPKADNNELQSIDIFKKFAAQLNLPDTLTEKVCHYIEATTTHSLKQSDNTDEDLKLFLDFDLEVLGRSRAEYEVYARQIREEYIYFSEEKYVKGRLGVLEKFLERDRLYFSEALRAELEVRARRNLGAEIEGLKAKRGDFS